MSNSTAANASQAIPTAEKRQTNTSFIVHLGAYQIFPKEVINTETLDEHNSPRYVTDTWILPGRREVDLTGIAELAAQHHLPVTFERV